MEIYYQEFLIDYWGENGQSWDRRVVVPVDSEDVIHFEEARQYFSKHFPDYVLRNIIFMGDINKIKSFNTR